MGQCKYLAKFHQVSQIKMLNPRGGSITDGHLTEMVKYLHSEIKDRKSGESAQGQG